MKSVNQSFTGPELKKQFEEELTGNILPFWINHVVDKENGGFYGAVSNDLKVHNEEPRSAVVCARILWTYSMAYRKLGSEQYLSMARLAYDYLTKFFWDKEYGGLYWNLDYKGFPTCDRKHHYAQAFGIYGLSEYYLATQEKQSLAKAKEIFILLEKHAYEPDYNGYIEGCSREWEILEDMRLSDKEINCRKSMNTMLHILEAYTNLLRVWNDEHLKAQHKSLVEVFKQYIINQNTGHFRLFFDDRWQSLSDHISFGHDIEGSWLLYEAAEVQGDEQLLAQVRQNTINMANSVFQEGLDEDGSMFNESDGQKLVDDSKSWWVQTEAVVGFYNAYQLTVEEKFKHAAFRCWIYIQEKLVDRKYGDWFKQLDRNGVPDYNTFKTGPWLCPYHHSRMCFEMMDRLDRV